MPNYIVYEITYMHYTTDRTCFNVDAGTNTHKYGHGKRKHIKTHLIQNSSYQQHANTFSTWKQTMVMHHRKPWQSLCLKSVHHTINMYNHHLLVHTTTQLHSRHPHFWREELISLHFPTVENSILNARRTWNCGRSKGKARWLPHCSVERVIEDDGRPYREEKKNHPEHK